MERYVCRLPRSKSFFYCSMLQKHTQVQLADGTKATKWQTMSCDDPDDYESLVAQQFVIADFELRSKVWVLARGLEQVPRPREGLPPFCREGVVRTVSGERINVEFEPCKPFAARPKDKKWRSEFFGPLARSAAQSLSFIEQPHVEGGAKRSSSYGGSINSNCSW